MTKFEEIKQHIEGLLRDIFQEEDYKPCFLLEVKQGGSNKIQVYIDHDTGVSFDLCRQISRYLEAHLDEHPLVPERYVLEVSSPGADRPLQLPRQYTKHVGRVLRVALADGEKLKGKLVDVSDDEIKIEKKIKKQKTAETISISFDEIAGAEVLITFN